jgi:hypothetical protein
MKTLLTLVAVAVAAQDLSPERVAGLETPWLHEQGWRQLNANGLNGWHTRDGKPGTWFTARAVDCIEKRIVARPAPGAILVNGPDGKTADLVTGQKFGDIELYVEWMIPRGSNSGVYLHGLYEVQIFDSYGKTQLGTIDAGAIYNRWIDEKAVGGSPPRLNASRAPGEWQSFHIWFRAPRFKEGKKIENARFIKVVYNAQTVQQDVEVDGPTRAHMDLAEAPVNPLMLQGDHGPVAFRNIWVKPLRATESRE